MPEHKDPQSAAASILCELLLDGRVAALTLNRPERKNALGPAEWQALSEHLGQLSGQKELRAVLVRGAGEAFSSGGDLRSMPERLEWPPAVREQQLRRDAQVIATLYELELPVVAQIDGPCMGAGLALALACDLRVASDRASFGAVFHRVGLSADFGLSFLLPRAVGPSRACELLLTAEVLDATQAREAGLVQRVVPQAQLAEETLALCRRLADGPPLAQAVSKRGLRQGFHTDLRTAIAGEAQAQTLLGKTADAREGVAAFLAKRPPKFRGE
jgi:2-(1,2-epoxy-1,2-dihydrophenyl)acetyl-CoA isomerase